MGPKNLLYNHDRVGVGISRQDLQSDLLPYLDHHLRTIFNPFQFLNYFGKERSFGVILVSIWPEVIGVQINHYEHMLGNYF